MSDTHIPADAICAFDGCGHRYDLHVPDGAWICTICLDSDDGACWSWLEGFNPIKLCGGALSPSQEQEAYEKAKRGEL